MQVRNGLTYLDSNIWTNENQLDDRFFKITMPGKNKQKE